MKTLDAPPTRKQISDARTILDELEDHHSKIDRFLDDLPRPLAHIVEECLRLTKPGISNWPAPETTERKALLSKARKLLATWAP